MTLIRPFPVLQALQALLALILKLQGGCYRRKSFIELVPERKSAFGSNRDGDSDVGVDIVIVIVVIVAVVDLTFADNPFSNILT